MSAGVSVLWTIFTLVYLAVLFILVLSLAKDSVSVTVSAVINRNGSFLTGSQRTNLTRRSKWKGWVRPGLYLCPTVFQNIRPRSLLASVNRLVL